MTLSVYLAPTLRDVAGTLVLASLPLSCRRVAAPDEADVVLLDGADAWQRDVGLDKPTIIVEPGTGKVPPAALLLDSRWATNPAVPCLAEAIATAAWQHLELRAILPTGTDLPQAVLDLVVLARAVGCPAESLRIMTQGPEGITASAKSAAGQLDLAVTLTNALPPCAQVRALTEDGDVSAHIPDPATARPAEVAITDATGVRTFPSLWESAHRAALRRFLHGHPCDDAPAFAQDVQLVNNAFSEE